MRFENETVIFMENFEVMAFKSSFLIKLEIYRGIPPVKKYFFKEITAFLFSFELHRHAHCANSPNPTHINILAWLSRVSFESTFLYQATAIQEHSHKIE